MRLNGFDGPAVLAESYVNLIPTPQGGTHVNGLRSGLIDALKEFCEFRDLIPRGVKLTGDDIWEQCSYVLSAKLADPQFAGQTKERCHLGKQRYLLPVLQKMLSAMAQRTRQRRRALRNWINNAQKRIQAAKKLHANESPLALPCRVNWLIVLGGTLGVLSCF